MTNLPPVYSIAKDLLLKLNNDLIMNLISNSLISSYEHVMLAHYCRIFETISPHTCMAVMPCTRTIQWVGIASICHLLWRREHSQCNQLVQMWHYVIQTFTSEIQYFSFVEWIFPPLYDLQFKIYFQQNGYMHQAVASQCFDNYFPNTQGKLR